MLNFFFFPAAHSGPSSSLLRLRFPKLYLAFKFLLSRFKNTATGRCIFFCRLLRAVTFTSPSSQSFTIPPDFFSSVFRRLKFLHGCHPLMSINDRLYVTVEQITNFIYFIWSLVCMLLVSVNETIMRHTKCKNTWRWCLSSM